MTYLRWAVAGQALGWAGFLASGGAAILALWSLASEQDHAPTALPIWLLVLAGGVIPTQTWITSVVADKASAAGAKPPRPMRA
jgi:hypothetical protein